MYKLGVDIGGTKLEAVLISQDNLIIRRKRVATQANLGCLHIISRIGKLVQEILHGEGTIKYKVGVGSPGSISPETGLLRNSNTLCLNNKPLKELIESELNCPVVLENDANCFALAESLEGAGKNFDSVFGIILGTGCGGGIIIKGQRLIGKNFIAGEWGHHSIDINGRECWCGKKGCVETYLSGSGVEKQYYELTGKHISAREIFSSETKFAIQIKDSFYEMFGRGVANVCNILDPDVIVVGGGLSNVLNLYDLGLESLKKYTFTSNLRTKLVKNLLGDSAGVIGAAHLTDKLVF
ncbi:MAG: N-acetylglucosamine kinase [Betaproteobacteria bacterium TMED156]|nr:MAG: N-acetylglucosamine kinase [Betaproteobacteria bacterium TMED156]